MKTSIDLIAPASAATSELHRRFCSDVPNDGTYTLHLNETETIRFFAELDRLEAAHVAQRVAEAVAEAVAPLEKRIEELLIFEKWCKSNEVEEALNDVVLYRKTFETSVSKSVYDTLAALVVRLKEALQFQRWCLEQVSADPKGAAMRRLDEALALAPTDLADSVVVSAREAAMIDDNGRLEATVARLEAELAKAKRDIDGGNDVVRYLQQMNDLSEADVARLREALARVESERNEAAKRAHKHRLAFDWMVAEMVPGASLDDIEQLWQEAHTALRSDGG